MEYINAEKLRSVLQNTINSMKEKDAKGERYDAFLNGKLSICEELLGCIDSLQQEQPESICPRCAYHNKTDDFCEYPYGGRKCSINENGVYECNGFEVVEQQEQPEVDLEREIRDYFSKWGYNIYNGAITMDNGIVVTLSSIQNVARHFWNKGYNARKK